MLASLLMQGAHDQIVVKESKPFCHFLKFQSCGYDNDVVVGEENYALCYRIIICYACRLSRCTALMNVLYRPFVQNVIAVFSMVDKLFLSWNEQIVFRFDEDTGDHNGDQGQNLIISDDMADRDAYPITWTCRASNVVIGQPRITQWEVKMMIGKQCMFSSFSRERSGELT